MRWQRQAIRSMRFRTVATLATVAVTTVAWALLGLPGARIAAAAEPAAPAAVAAGAPGVAATTPAAAGSPAPAVPAASGATAAPAAPLAIAAPAAATPRITEYTPPAAEYARAVAYSHQKYLQFFVNFAYGLLIFILVLAWRVPVRLRDLAERASRRRFVQLLVFAPAMLGVVTVLGLPSDTWDQSLEKRYGLSVQTWQAWFGDWIMNSILFLVFGTILVWILYAVVRRSARRWWFYFWLASLPVLVLVLFAAPLVIQPLFYQFKPLAAGHPDLVAQIERVTQHGGLSIPADRMFEMNASSKTTGLNAYVAGFGASKRVVVWDTTMAKATIPETLFVFGHEMGHYVLYHIPLELGIGAAILLVLLYLGYRLATWMAARWGAVWGVRGLDDWASLPIMMFVLALLFFFATPAFNTMSRHYEHEADRYGLEVIHGIVADPQQVAARYFQKSGEINLSDPDPNLFVKLMFFDHPPRRERVRFVATYDPWSTGEGPRYVK